MFNDYFNYLINYNKTTNLTTVTEKKEVYLKHFYDSLLVAKFYRFTNEKVLDIGTGPGFPGIPLLICFPEIDLTVIESNNKKVLFLNNLKNILKVEFNIVNDRAEIYIENERNSYDIVVSRAVAHMGILMELAIPYLKVNGLLIAYKSRVEKELNNIEKGLKLLSATLQRVETTNLKDAIIRSFVFIQKNDTTNIKYPRAYKKIKKNPL